MTDELTSNPAEDRSRPRARSSNGRPGPYSSLIDRGAVGGLLDGRSREGRYLRSYEKMLVDHVGGSPSVVQRALITRAARLALHLQLLDERAFTDGRGLGETDCHFYIAWSNALARHLSHLGVQSPAATTPSAPSLADLFPNRAPVA